MNTFLEGLAGWENLIRSQLVSNWLMLVSFIKNPPSWLLAVFSRHIYHKWTPTVCCFSSLCTPTHQLVQSTSRFLGKVVYYDNRKSPKLLSRVAVSQTGTLREVQRTLKIASHTSHMLANVCMCSFIQPLVLFKLPQEDIPYTVCVCGLQSVVLISLTDCFQKQCGT